VSAVDDFEDAYGRLTNREAGVKGRLSNTLELICDASEAPDDADVLRAARRAIVRIGDRVLVEAVPQTPWCSPPSGGFFWKILGLPRCPAEPHSPLNH
jgi:hypothetical protein